MKTSKTSKPKVAAATTESERPRKVPVPRGDLPQWEFEVDGCYVQWTHRGSRSRPELLPVTIVELEDEPVHGEVFKIEGHQKIDAVRAAIRAYTIGFRRGEESGVAGLRSTIKDALGLR